MNNPYNSATHPYAWLGWEAAHNVPLTSHIERWLERRMNRRAEADRRAAKLRSAKRAERAAWASGVAKIMAEVRRREMAWAAAEPPFFTSDNPLDGARLWGGS